MKNRTRSASKRHGNVGRASARQATHSSPPRRVGTDGEDRQGCASKGQGKADTTASAKAAPSSVDTVDILRGRMREKLSSLGPKKLACLVAGSLIVQSPPIGRIVEHCPHCGYEEKKYLYSPVL